MRFSSVRTWGAVRSHLRQPGRTLLMMLTRKAFSDDAVNDDDGNDELMIFD